MEEFLGGANVKEEELSAVAQRLLRIQCIFLIEKEIETLKSRGMMREISEYIQNAKIINFNRILLMIVKNFTEKYFSEVRGNLMKVLKNAPHALGGENIEEGKAVLNKCLITLEKRMFENLFNELDEQPLYYLTVLNMFNLDFVKSEERYKIIFDNNLKVLPEEGMSEDKVITVKCINIFDLIKYVYYNTIIEAKIALSQRIFKKFLEENALEDLRKLSDANDPCEKFMKRPVRKVDEQVKKEQIQQDKLLKIVEYLIKEMWDNLPDLKNPIGLKKDKFMVQLGQLMNDCDDETNSFYEEDIEDEQTNWSYMVTRDGETLYLNAPSYKAFEEFRPGPSRNYEFKPSFTEEDLERFVNPPIKDKCQIPDAFDLKMETILCDGKRLVGDELGVEDRANSKYDKIISYVKIRNKIKKRQLISNELWNLFQKKYFTFEEESEDVKGKKCSNPIRPHEFYDMVPRFVTYTVRPISEEFDKFKYICAACGYFINKGTGVEAMGYKWHNEHLRCRVCCESFKEKTEFLLYRGVVICKHDAKIMFS